MRHTRQRTHHAAKQSHTAQSADRRPSRHTGTGTDPHAPAAQPAILAAHQLPIPAWLSYPSPLPKQNPLHPTLPHHAGTDPHDPAAQPAIFPVTNSPFPHISPIQAPLPPKRSPTRPALPYHAGTDPHDPATQPAIFPVTSSPIPAQLSSPADPYKNPGSRPPPGFFVISGSVRSPSQRRLR